MTAIRSPGGLAEVVCKEMVLIQDEAAKYRQPTLRGYCCPGALGFATLNTNLRVDRLEGRAEAIRRSLLTLLLYSPLAYRARFTRNGAIIEKEFSPVRPAAKPSRWALLR